MKAAKGDRPVYPVRNLGSGPRQWPQKRKRYIWRLDYTAATENVVLRNEERGTEEKCAGWMNRGPTVRAPKPQRAEDPVGPFSSNHNRELEVHSVLWPHRGSHEEAIHLGYTTAISFRRTHSYVQRAGATVLHQVPGIIKVSKSGNLIRTLTESGSGHFSSKGPTPQTLGGAKANLSWTL